MARWIFGGLLIQSKLMKRTDVFGVIYDNLTFKESVDVIAGFCRGDVRKTIFFLNADYLYKALHDAEYAKILNWADLVLPDGVGLRLVSFFCGKKMVGNCNGTDLTPVILGIAANQGYKVYFLGGKDENVAKAKNNLSNWFPGLRIVGMHSGYFNDDDDDDEGIVFEINKSQADILIVSMGAPLQEKWLYQNRDKLNPLLCMAVGGWMDYPGERLKRAPLWMRKMNLEWVWRIYQDPKSMLARYWKSGTFLFWLLIKSLFFRKKC
jgi:N-acetylglucosaminyldiphosphoundecaprenol N-acetyl-beta-D-mannosaminyltransferase